MASKMCKKGKKDVKNSDAEFICKSCGAASNKEKKLCKPTKNK